MSRFLALSKMNMKLLLRNKGFIFFLCVVPIVSVIILNMKTEASIYSNKEVRTNIVELKKSSERAVYVSDTTAFVIKVYDASKTELSEYVLEELANSGMFSVCRADVRNLTNEQVLEQAKRDAFDDRAGILLYIKEDFDTCVMEGYYEDAIQIYMVSEDERYELFETELKDSLWKIHQLAKSANMSSSEVLNILNSIKEEIPQKEVVSLSGKEDIALTNEQISQKSNIGYAISIITLGFLFCGVCVAYTVIEERDNKVYTRVMLSKTSTLEYLSSKFLMAIIISIMQTGLLGGCMLLIKDLNFGIGKIDFLIVIFFLGLIISAVSIMLGILIGDVMSSNYTAFGLWSVSSMLSGLLFELDFTTKALKGLSDLMPQRWFMKAVELLFVGDKSAYSMILYVTVAYLIVVMSVGSILLKMKQSDC